MAPQVSLHHICFDSAVFKYGLLTHFSPSLAFSLCHTQINLSTKTNYILKNKWPLGTIHGSLVTLSITEHELDLHNLVIESHR